MPWLGGVDGHGVRGGRVGRNKQFPGFSRYKRFGTGGRNGNGALPLRVGAEGARKQGAIHDKGIGLAILVVGDLPRAKGFKAVGGVEVVPFAEGLFLERKVTGVGGVGCLLVHGVEIKHRPCHVALVFFPWLEAAVYPFAVKLDFLRGYVRLHLVEVVPLGCLCVGYFGEGEIVPCGIDRTASGEQVVHVAFRVARGRPFGLGPGMLAVDAVVGAAHEKPTGWVFAGGQVKSVAGIDALYAVVQVVNFTIQRVTGMAIIQHDGWLIGLNERIQQGRALQTWENRLCREGLTKDKQ